MLHKIPIEKPLVLIQPEQPPANIFWASNVQCNLCEDYEIASGNNYGFMSDNHYGCATRFFEQNNVTAEEVFFCECGVCDSYQRVDDEFGNRLGGERKTVHYFGDTFQDDEEDYTCSACHNNAHPIVPSWLIVRSRWPDAT